MSSPIRPPLWITETDGNPSGRPINKIIVSNGTLTINGTTATITTGGAGGGGTVTNVSSTDSFISISNPNTTPVITIQDATTSQSGILTSTDWNTFNNKGSGTIGGSIANAQVAVGSGTNTISGGNSLLFDGTSLTVNTGANDPELNLTNSSKAVTLKVTTSQKLTIQGSSDTFVFDASSNTGGITFPDGTTQNTAASGGGGTIGGSISDNRVAVGASTADDIEGYSDFTYNDTTNTLTVGEKIDSSSTSPLQLIAGSSSISILDSGVNNHINISPASGRINAQSSLLSVGTNAADTVISSNGAYDLTLNTNDGTNSGSIVIADGIDGQISITPNGAGTIKLDGVELDNSAIATGKVLKATSANAAGWVTEGGATTSPAGSNTQVQFNDNGSFGANNKMQYTAASGVLTLTNYAQFNNIQVGFNAGVITTNSAGNMTLQPFYGINAGTIVIGGTSNSDITLTPDGTGKVKISDAYTLPSAVTTANDYVLTAQTDGTTAWAASAGISWSTPVDSNIIPNTDDSYDIGSLTKQFKNAFFDGTVRTDNLTVDSTATVTANISVGGGSYSTPSYNFTNDTDCGMGKEDTNAIFLGTNGSPRLKIYSDGAVDLVDSKLKIANSYGSDGQVLTSTGSGVAWENAGGGSTSPAGSNKQLQFNNNGAFGASDRCQLEIFSPSGNAGFGLNLNGAAFTSNGFLIYAQGNTLTTGQVFGNEFLCSSSSSSDVGYGSQLDQDTGIAFSSSDQVDIVTGGSYNISFGSSKEILLEGTNAGTSGQVLRSNGAGAKVAWDNPKALSGTPTSSTATGSAGDLQYDADYLYVCIAVNSWKRVGLSAW